MDRGEGRAGARHEAGLVAAALAVSVPAYLLVAHQDLVLGYKDTISHLLVGRRVLVGQHPGLAQLGGIWLPLQHVLIALLSWSDRLYLSGLAGSVVSMLSFVATCVGLHRSVWLVTGSRAGGWAAAAVFGLAPNVLYLQATPMGEPLMYALMAWMTVAVLTWQVRGSTGWLFVGALLGAALVMTRYEGWVFAAAMWGVVAHVCVVRRYRLWRGDQRAQGTLLVFGFYMAAAVVGWLVWNAVVFDDWLGWYRGTYTSTDQTAALAPVQAGDLRRSALTYGWATVHVAGTVALVTGLLGLVVMAWRERCSPYVSCFLAALAPMAFVFYGLWAGTQPMNVVEVDGTLYNLRMALVVLLPAALFTGYLVAALGSVRPRRTGWVRAVSTGALAAVLAGTLVRAAVRDESAVVLVAEARAARDSYAEQRALGAWLSTHTDGRVLMESFANEWVVFPVQRRLVYEGSAADWEVGLVDPAARDIDVVVMRTTPGDGDRVFAALGDGQGLRGYRVVHRTADFVVYERVVRRAS